MSTTLTKKKTQVQNNRELQQFHPSNPQNTDSSQLKAIQSDISKPLIITAGPGSGKTHTILQRISHIHSIDTEAKALLLTFSTKVRRELYHRINKDLRSLCKIQTVHSLCFGLICQQGEKPIVFLPKKCKTLIREILIKLNPNRYDVEKVLPERKKDSVIALNKEVKKVQKEIDIFKSKMKNYEQIPSKSDSIHDPYVLYQKELAKEKAIDFGDFMPRVLKILTSSDKILSNFTKKYKYILIDEFQDFSETQYCLLELLYSKNQRISLIGDEDQAIYGFRGGSPLYFDRFKNLIESKKQELNQVQLVLNYRSSSVIIDSFSSLIAKNKCRTPKNIVPVNSTQVDSLVRVIKYTDEDDQEVLFVCDEIQSLILIGTPLAEIAILSRVNVTSAAFRKELKKRKIACTSEKFDAGVIPWLEMIGDAYEDPKIFYLTLCQLTGITKMKSVAENYVKANPKFANLKPWDMILQISKFAHHTRKLSTNIVGFSTKMMRSLADFIKKLTELKADLTQSKGFLDFFENVWAKTQEDTDDFDYDQTKEIISQYCEGTNKSDEKTTPEDIIDFINFWQSRPENQGDEKKKNCVFVSTIHQSKGLEFENVYIVRCNHKFMPMDVPNVDKEEERRIMYVAMSRSKKNLIITCKEKQESIYIQEISPQWIKWEKMIPRDVTEEVPKTVIESHKVKKESNVTESPQSNQNETPIAQPLTPIESQETPLTPSKKSPGYLDSPPPKPGPMSSPRPKKQKTWITKAEMDPTQHKLNFFVNTTPKTVSSEKEPQESFESKRKDVDHDESSDFKKKKY